MEFERKPVIVILVISLQVAIRFLCRVAQRIVFQAAVEREINHVKEYHVAVAVEVEPQGN